jgi:hypothetical protein
MCLLKRAREKIADLIDASQTTTFGARLCEFGRHGSSYNAENYMLAFQEALKFGR